MTAPLTQTAAPLRIDMTAPVTLAAVAGGMRVRLVLLKGVTLAMKSLALRIGTEFHDEDDIRHLLRHLDIGSYGRQRLHAKCRAWTWRGGRRT